MNTKIIAAAVLTFSLASCEKVLVSEPSIDATVGSVILEYERPVVHVTRSKATDMYIPCQAIIDGEPVTILNAAVTTLQNTAAQDIRLPRLNPGRHEIELVYGKARKLYRDAEAACGERVSSSRLSVQVNESPANVLVLSAARTDIDRYLFFPDEDRAVECNTGTSKYMSDMTVMPDIYTVQFFPSAAQNGSFSISRVGERITVSETGTLIGHGIEIVMHGTLEKGNENSMFTLSAGGRDYRIQAGF